MFVYIIVHILERGWGSLNLHVHFSYENILLHYNIA